MHGMIDASGVVCSTKLISINRPINLTLSRSILVFVFVYVG